MGYDPQSDDFAPLMEPVARAIMGEPNKALSRPDELRFGTKGAIAVIPSKGVYHDWHDDSGGGVLKFVETYGMMERSAALNYLRQFGLAKKEDRAVQVEKPKRRIHSLYDYVDEDGELLFQVVRFVDGDPRFLQRRPDPENANAWIWNTKDVRKIPYRLPELQDALAHERPIWIVEGEKDVDNLARLGIAATCNPGGAGKFPQPCIDALKGAHVVLCPDNDDAGRKHVEFVQSALAGVAASITRVTLPGLPDKGDVSDFIEQHPDNPADAIWREYERQSREPRVEAPVSKSKYRRIRFDEIDDVERTTGYVIKNIIPANAFGLIYGDSQAGKSFVAIDIALHVAMGRAWNGHRVRNGGVIYQCGEGEYGILNRFKAARNALGAPKRLPIEIIPQPVDLWSPTGDTEALVNEFQAIAKTLAEPLSLIVIDTHATASAGADENSAKDMTLLIAHYKQIALATGATVLVVHHRNAEGSKMRGHTSLPAAADFTIEITVDGKVGDKNRRRSWTTIKQKDGENGISGDFLLRRVVLSIDRDGDEVSSCFIEPIEKENRTSSRAASTMQSEALACLRDILALSQHIVPEEIAPEWVEAVVKNDDWRDEFCNRHSRGNLETTRQAFYRARKELLADKTVATSGKLGDDFVWLTSDGRRRAYRT